MGPREGGLVRRIAEALILLVAIALVSHWVYELLRPLIPMVITGLFVILVLMAVLRRRRW